MLTFSLALDQDTYPTPAQPKLTVRLTNAGTQPVLVNRRLAVNDEDAAADECEVKLSVVAPSGKTLPFTARVNVGEPEDRHFAPLGPGASVARDFVLTRAYDLSEQGRYTVTGHYQNLSDTSTAPAWKGAVSSETIGFEVFE